MSTIEKSTGLNILCWSLRAVVGSNPSADSILQIHWRSRIGLHLHACWSGPWGRIGSGIVELIAAILLLTPRFTWLGSVLALGVMAGAILSHLTILGIEVQGDKGLLFGLAVTVFTCAGINLFLHRTQLPIIGRRLG